MNIVKRTISKKPKKLTKRKSDGQELDDIKVLVYMSTVCEYQYAQKKVVLCKHPDLSMFL